VREVNAGIYSVQTDFLWRALCEVKPQNAQGEFYLTDIVAMAAAHSEVATVQADFAETAGVNDRVDLSDCTRVLQGRINRALMKGGVTLLDPATAYIAEDVQLGPDCVVGPQVSIGPGCRVGAGVTLDQGCVLERTTVGEGTHLKAYSVLEQTSVGPACHIGPFARLRPGTELAEGVHIGNFVETKKARIGKGSKASHLSYLGNARIGAGVNVGAGTITCNYDGVSKHETVLGDGVFIGSDTQLVAPVTVGEGAYVGAGTTVTKDVPPQSLAVSRTPQTVKEGWAERKRARQQAARASGPAKGGTPEGR
jgi:bifunctional UDP-N-acetylglucosamine pyrophosphorylase/glucosamine-1-phosphate N-acetyltransferase